MFIKKKSCSNSNDSAYFVFLFIFLLTISACQSNKNSSSQKHSSTAPAANDDYFQEIGKEIGLDFVHSIGDKELSNIVESSGAGAAFLDYDQDGFIDLYVCNGTWVKGTKQWGQT